MVNGRRPKKRIAIDHRIFAQAALLRGQADIAASPEKREQLLKQARTADCSGEAETEPHLTRRLRD